jgi:hypothetical protein
MDPDACVRRILDALRDSDRDDLVEALDDLSGWLANGGVMPTDPHADIDYRYGR